MANRSELIDASMPFSLADEGRLEEVPLLIDDLEQLSNIEECKMVSRIGRRHVRVLGLILGAFLRCFRREMSNPVLPIARPQLDVDE